MKTVQATIRLAFIASLPFQCGCGGNNNGV
jgi:hypothetical protein